MFEQLVAAAPQGVVDDLLHLPMPPAEKAIRTVAIYLGILLVIRVAGKRLMAQMNSQDLVVVNAALDHWALHSPRVAWLLDGRPTVVVEDGVLDLQALAHVGMSPEELNNAVQTHGADSLSEVQRVALEPGGSITVELKPDARSATIGDLRRAVDALTARLDSQGGAGAR